MIDSSSNEETKIVKQGSRGKGKLMVKPSYSSEPAKTKRSQLVGGGDVVHSMYDDDFYTWWERQVPALE